MKKFTKSLIIILLITLMTGFTYGCNNSIKYGKVFSEYFYSEENGAFYPSNRFLTLNKDKTFSMSLESIGEIGGIFELYNDQNLIKLTYGSNFTDKIIEEFKKELQNNPKSSFTYEEIEELINSIQFSDLFYNYDNYLFSNSFIEAYRYVDLEQNTEENYLSVEGVYVVKDFEVLMLLKDGIIYIQDSKKPVDNEFPTQRGTYAIEKDFMVMNFVLQEQQGSEIVSTEYVMKYLIAEVALPQDLKLSDYADETLTEDEEWLEKINEQLQSLQGKKIKALVKAFYTYRSL